MYESSDSLEGNWLTKTAVFKQQLSGCATERSTVKTVLIICATVLDVVIVVGIAALEYFFRWTNLFPIRKRSVEHLCPNSSSADASPISELEEFWSKAEIPEIAVYIYSFSFPIVIILIGEVLVFILANQSTKLLPGGTCSPLHIPHTIRRLYRFSLSFLFGILCLMVIVDSIKIIVGQIRPNFDVLCCQIPCHNQTFDCQGSQLKKYGACSDVSTIQIRKARTSCPSTRSAISMYAALFTTAYLHGIGFIHHSKYLFIPLLNITQILITILYGISLVARKDAWWSDVLVGHLLGAIVALYLTFCVLRKFKFQETVSNRRIFRQLALLHTDGRFKENKDVPKIIDSCLEPVRLRRAHAPCTSYTCNCAIGPPLTSAHRPSTDDTSTFFPIPKPNRKSVTLPISSPHIPMNHTTGDNKTDVANHRTCNIENRLSAVNLSRRHIILSQNMPKISQELINLLNSKSESQAAGPGREFINLSSTDKAETSIL